MLVENRYFLLFYKFSVVYDLVNAEAFKYRFIGSSKKGELLKRRSIKNDCTATVYFGKEKNIVIQLKEQHNYDGNSLNKILRQVLLENSKQRIEESISI